jgi:hypothetical protein
MGRPLIPSHLQNGAASIPVQDVKAAGALIEADIGSLGFDLCGNVDDPTATSAAHCGNCLDPGFSLRHAQGSL